jgi:hypothetical protein
MIQYSHVKSAVSQDCTLHVWKFEIFSDS